MESRIHFSGTHEFGIRNPRVGIRDPGSGIRDPLFGIRKSGIGGPPGFLYIGRHSSLFFIEHLIMVLSLNALLRLLFCDLSPKTFLTSSKNYSVYYVRLQTAAVVLFLCNRKITMVMFKKTSLSIY